MPGNPVRPKPERDLSAIPGTLSPEENRQRIKSEDEAMKAFIASMPEGDVLDYLRAPINLFSNSMAGLGAEMIGKGKRFEEKYGWKPKTQAEMNAVNSLLQVMDPAIEAMDYLKIPPVVGPNVPTIAAAMRGVDRAAVNLSGQQAAAAARKGATAAKNAVRDVATSDAAYDIMNRLAEATGTAPKQIMMGPMSKTWNHGNAALAKHMELQGESPEAIWQATGTFRGADGLWRQEIPDVDMKYTGNAVERKQYESAKKRHEQATARATTPEEVNDANDYWNKTRTDAIFNLTGKAPDFVNHPELFAAYPELSKLAFKQLQPTHKEFTAPETVYGFYSPTKQRITISTDAPEKKSTALHELQHAIQKIEGWQGGSSPEYIAAKMAERDLAKASQKRIQDKIDELKAADPIGNANLIRDYGISGDWSRYILNQTEPLEGITDPYAAYKKMSGEEEARMVQARRDYNKIGQDSLPVLDYETPPSEQITKNFADGGAVMMAKGGFLGVLERTAKQGVERAAKAAKPIESVVQVSTIKMPKAAQEVVSDAERAANLAKFLEKSKSKKRLYHGTNSDFSVFDASRAGENTDSNASSEAYAQTARLGHWLNTNPMAGPKAGYEVDMPVYVSIKNPKREMSLDWLAQGLEGTTGKEYRDQLIKEGYDGIVLPDEEFGGESWVAFSPEQIKSALGNRGTYDINEKDITKANGGEVHMMGGGRTGILGALARTAERGLEKAVKAAPQDEALRLAQLRAALPTSQGGLGLPASNTPMDRAKAMKFDLDKNYVHNTSLPFDKIKEDGKFSGIFALPNYSANYGNVDMPLVVRGKIASSSDLKDSIKNPSKQKKRAINEELPSNIKDPADIADAYVEMQRRRNELARGLGYTGVKINDEFGDTVSLVSPENIRSRFAAFDPFRKDAATAALFGVAAPDLLAKEQEPEKELTIDEFLNRMKAR